MMPLRACLLVGVGVCATWAQTLPGPVISPRGVINFFTQQPAPARIGSGGLIQIIGLNLGPPEGITATGTPWPTRLGDVQVLLNNRPVPVYSATPGAIIAQVPADLQGGVVEVAVRRQSGTSAPSRITVMAIEPAVRAADDSGAGAPWTAPGSQSLTLAASGLGPTQPRIPAGDTSPADNPAKPVQPISAFVGGYAADVKATASSTRPGEFDVALTVPAAARPGDLITLLAGNAVANSTVYQPSQSIDVQAVRLPADAPTGLTTLLDTGLNGNFLIATGARGDDGCYKAVAFDMVKKSAKVLDDCLTSAVAALPPVVSSPNGDSIAALVGPPQGDVQTGVSTRVKVWSAAREAVSATLPSPAALLLGTQTGDYAAALPGTPPSTVTIDAQTGEVKAAAAAGGGAGGIVVPGAGGAVPGGGAAGLANLSVDGLTHVYAQANAGQGVLAVSIGDDATRPTKAAFALVTTAGVVRASQPFPAGWLPLLGAVRTAVGQGVPVLAAALREAISLDAASRRVFALARSADGAKHAFIAFSLDNTDPKIVAFPDGWFATACIANNLPLFTLELSSRVALLGSKVADNEFKANCAASGFLLLDPTAATVSAAAAPVQAQLLASSAREMNDYVFGTSLDPTRTAASDRLLVLDGLNGSVFALGMPAGVDAFSDNSLRLVPQINSLVAAGIKTIAGDQGLVVFNLDQQMSASLPVPDGYAVVSTIADHGTPCCLATRKLVAVADKTGGSNLVVYNLATNDLAVVPNPEGVTGVGRPRATANPGGGGAGGAGGGGFPVPGGGGGGVGIGVPGAVAAANPLLLSNTMANTVAAIAMAGNRQVGVIVVRIP